MKHVKSYESLTPEDIKQYIIWNQSTYEILKFEEVIDDRIWCYDYLYYNDGEFFLNESNSSFWLYIDSPYLIFSSDDLEECKKYIRLKASQNKYNL